MSTVLVTGAAGFIGSHVAQALLDRGDQVVGFDNFNDYYDPSLKEHRSQKLEAQEGFRMVRGDLKDLEAVQQLFADQDIHKICHLAAQAGVRYSLEHPHSYIQSNLVGFTHLIDEAKRAGIKTFVYASSSSVYGKNKKVPFAVEDHVDHPISLYAATKKANELIAHTYHHLYGMQCTGLRFFTVYGPMGRPDMALFKFTKAMLAGEAIDVYNHGKMRRDFTYIDDIVAGVLASIDASHEYEVFNLGNHRSVELEYFIACLEKELGISAQKNLLPMQPGDVAETYADIEASREKLGFDPQTPIEEGIKRFVSWYKDYYNVA